jgi:hypothetical protein
MVLYNQFLEEDKTRLAEAEDIALKNMAVFKIESRYRTPKGHLRWALLRSTPGNYRQGSFENLMDER